MQELSRGTCMLERGQLQIDGIIYIYICLCIYIYMCVYVYICVYIYVCMYVCIH